MKKSDFIFMVTVAKCFSVLPNLKTVLLYAFDGIPVLKSDFIIILSFFFIFLRHAHHMDIAKKNLHLIVTPVATTKMKCHGNKADPEWNV